MSKIKLMLIFTFLVNSANAADYVRGYYRKDGTYVQPHYRTAPDRNIHNNYSTQGNYNPYSGKEGRVNPYPQYYNKPKNFNNDPYNFYQRR